MADIINLNKIRKKRDRAVLETRAKQNRVTFGQKKSDKKAAGHTRSKESKDLDGRKLDGSD